MKSNKMDDIPVSLVSSCLVTPKNRLHPIRIMLNNLRWSLMDYKFKGEEALRNSGLKKYTIVRPGGLTDGSAGKKKLTVMQGDEGRTGMVARGDVAWVVVQALKNEKAWGVTMELMSDKQGVSEGEEELKSLFDGLKKD
jgi:hypothetical protein